MRVAGDLLGLLLAAALPAWFFWRVIDSLRTGQARPTFRKQAYTRKQHPRAFAITLCIWVVWGLVCCRVLVGVVWCGWWGLVGCGGGGLVGWGLGCVVWSGCG